MMKIPEVARAAADLESTDFAGQTVQVAQVGQLGGQKLLDSNY